jgi:rod shape determining protein RodA
MITKELTGGNKIDYVLVSLYLSLVGIGWLMIYAVGQTKYAEMEFAEFMVKSPAGKQAIFIGISMVLLLLIFTIDGKFWRVFAYPLYAVGIVLLILVLIFGREINGARAWFTIAGFGFQPVEVAKLGTALALSSYLSSPSISLRDRSTVLTVLGLLTVPVFFIMLQPDAGSMLVFISFSIMLFREGLSPFPYIAGALMFTVLVLALMLNANELVMYLMMLTTLIFAFNISENQRFWLAGVVVMIGISAFSYFNWNPQMGLNLMLLGVLAFIVIHSRQGRFRLVIITTGTLLLSTILVYSTNFLVNNVLKKHQRERIDVWLRIDKCDPRGTAYNVIQSKMAIGSGSLQGKGFLEGTMTKLNYIPEQQTDFIFCTVGEEQGFIGVFALITIFVMLLYRMVQIGERHKSNFVRLYAYSLVGIFFFHLFINVGMTMGLLPVVGIPLPFVSAGGSSLLGFTAMMGVLLKLDSNRYSA